VIISKRDRKKVARFSGYLGSFCFAVLPCQRDLDRADVGWSTSFFARLRLQLLRANVNCLYFDVWQESASAYFNNVDCSADGSSSGFDFYFWCVAVEEGYAG
jgi:hypothetical protein